MRIFKVICKLPSEETSQCRNICCSRSSCLWLPCWLSSLSKVLAKCSCLQTTREYLQLHTGQNTECETQCDYSHNRSLKSHQYASIYTVLSFLKVEFLASVLMSAFNPVHMTIESKMHFNVLLISTTVFNSCLIQMDKDIFTCEKYRLRIKEVGGSHTQWSQHDAGNRIHQSLKLIKQTEDFQHGYNCLRSRISQVFGSVNKFLTSQFLMTMPELFRNHFNKELTKQM